MNVQLKFYLFQFKQSLPCDKTEKQNIVAFLKDGMADYLAAHPDCSYQELVRYFGKPRALAVQYLPEGVEPKKRLLESKPVARILVLTFGWVAWLVTVFVLAMFLLQVFVPTVPVHESGNVQYSLDGIYHSINN